MENCLQLYMRLLRIPALFSLKKWTGSCRRRMTREASNAVEQRLFILDTTRFLSDVNMTDEMLIESRNTVIPKNSRMLSE